MRLQLFCTFFGILLVFTACTEEVDPNNPCLTRQSESSGNPKDNKSLELFGSSVSDTIAYLLAQLPLTEYDNQYTCESIGKYVIWITGDIHPTFEPRWRDESGGIFVNFNWGGTASCLREIATIAYVVSEQEGIEEFFLADKLGRKKSRLDVPKYFFRVWVINIKTRNIIAFREFRSDRMKRTAGISRELLSYHVAEPVWKLISWLQDLHYQEVINTMVEPLLEPLELPSEPNSVSEP